MRLTILGNNGPYPSAGGACSGYLLQGNECNVLIDCGNGVLANLQKVIPFDRLDAIILTHLHSDHMSDMMVLRYAIQIKNNKGSMNRAIDVYAPDQPEDEYARLDIKGVFNLRPSDTGLKIRIGDIDFEFAPMKHPVKAFAVSASSGGKKFVFSGDTAWTDEIIGFSSGADLLMLDAGLLSKDKNNDNVPHLTALECGKVARLSKAKKLLLTHFWPEYDKGQLLAEASSEFGDVQLAEIMNVYEI